jgi:sodium transport system permease protein
MKPPSESGWAGAWIVFTKELKETLRDTRTLMIMVVVPVLLYPAILIASEQLALFGQRQLDREPAPVAVVGDVDSLFLRYVDEREDLALVPVGDPEGAIRADSVSAVALFLFVPGNEGNRAVSLLYDAADDRSKRGRALLGQALEAWGDTLLERRIAQQGLPEGFARPLVVADSSVALPSELGGYALGRFLPMLLVVMTLLGAFYPAIDLAAGEKERGTLETLLTAPIPAGQVVAGKFLTVTVVGLLAAALNLGSMLLTFQTGLFQLSLNIPIEFSLPFSSVLIIFAVLVPLAVLFGALFLGIAVRSQSFKEAQNALTPTYMVFLLPALLPLFPGIEVNSFLALLPVAGVALLFRELMTGNADLLLGAIALLSTLVYACAALIFAAHSFGREEVLFGDGRSADGPGNGRAFLENLFRSNSRGGEPAPAATLMLVAAVGVLFFYGAIRFQVAFGETGILVSQLVLLLLPALLFIRLGGYHPGITLSLERPDLRSTAAAVFLIAGGTPLVWFLTWLQGLVLPMPWEFVEGMSDFLDAGDIRRVAWLLVLVALTPALCEEVLFRGVLLSGIRRHMPPLAVVVANGIIFGAFHVPQATVFRFLPSAALGMLLAWVVLRTRSIWLSGLMHFLNNGSIVVLASSPWILERFSDPSQGPPIWLLLPAAASFMVGGFLLEGRRSGKDPAYVGESPGLSGSRGSRSQGVG